MDTKPLERFATWARQELLTAVEAQATAVLKTDSVARTERAHAVRALEAEINRHGREHVIDKVAYTWFNRIIALRFMDARGYTDTGVVSPAQGQPNGQPEILADAKRGNIDTDVITSSRTADAIIGLLDGTRRSTDAEGEAYALLLTAHCRYWHGPMPFMFEREDNYTELLVPTNLLADGAILSRVVEVLTEDVCDDVEVIGWLYQFYISERKDEVFAGFKKNKKAGADEIPAATQLFTPHWIVRYLVENSLGRLWMLNRPSSRLVDQMDYYIAPVDEETDFLKISSPEELTVIDPACGSGHMLTYAFDLLYEIYEEEGYAPSEIAGLILEHNLYGTEIDSRAGALAAFALTMKARGKQRTFFSKQVKPNICVIEPISFVPEEINFLVTRSSDRHEEISFWNQFAEADILGSLIKSDAGVTSRLVSRLETLDHGGDLLKANMITWAQRVVAQAKYLSNRYAVVVANPPYMGSRNMVPRLSDYARKNYRASKADLYSMFIDRCLSLALPLGQVGMITMQGWMFLPSFMGIRGSIVRDHRIVSLAHLGTRAFDSIGGEVVSTAAFVIENSGNHYKEGDYFRLTDTPGELGKSNLLRVNLGETSDEKIHWRTRQASFDDVPGAPIAYWASITELELFEKNHSVSDVSDVRAGMATGDNDYFIRQWFEVDNQRLKLDADDAEEVWNDPTSKWVIFNKGGESRRWYGHLDYVLAYDRKSHSMLKKSGNRCPSEEYYFRECLTWSDVTTGHFAPRYMPSGSVLSTVGNSIYENGMPLSELCCALASSAVSGMLPFLNPTLHANPGDVSRLPVPHRGDDSVFGDAVRIARADWHSVETAWGFTRPDWFQTGVAKRLLDIFRSSDDEWIRTVQNLAELESENDRRQRAAYGIASVSQPDPEGEETLDGVTLRRNFFRAGEWVTSEADRGRAIELVSYAVGCMFGRYSLDAPGLILADQGATLQDYLAMVPIPTFIPDADNVIPIVDGDWFEDDIVSRFRQFLRVAFGEEHFEENLRFVEDSLGVKTLRDYFITKTGRSKFYDDHVQRYKKRPIYWMFSSPKGSFNALIYMHRYTPSTVSTVLNEYLREYRGKLEFTLQNAEREAAGGRSSKAQKEADRIRKILIELAEYEHDVLYPLATQQVAIDLDDGVKVNYPKFGKALKKIKGLEAKE